MKTLWTFKAKKPSVQPSMILPEKTGTSLVIFF